MNERDKELHRQAGWSDSKLIELVRADAMEAATRAANVSWSLVCKKMVELEREACANIDFYDLLREFCTKDQSEMYAELISAAIRARRNT